jgi:hypothetical protein
LFFVFTQEQISPAFLYFSLAVVRAKN